MWAWVVSLPVTIANFSPLRAVPMGAGGWACLALAAGGLAVETVADYQVCVRSSLFVLLLFARVSCLPSRVGGPMFLLLSSKRALSMCISVGFMHTSLIKVASIHKLHLQTKKAMRPGWSLSRELSAWWCAGRVWVVRGRSQLVMPDQRTADGFGTHPLAGVCPKVMSGTVAAPFNLSFSLKFFFFSRLEVLRGNS